MAAHLASICKYTLGLMFRISQTFCIDREAALFSRPRHVLSDNREVVSRKPPSFCRPGWNPLRSFTRRQSASFNPPDPTSPHPKSKQLSSITTETLSTSICNPQRLTARPCGHSSGHRSLQADPVSPPGLLSHALRCRPASR